MAHLIVHRSAHAVRVALIMQRRRNTTHTGRHVVDNLVDFRRIHTLMNVLLNVIEHRDIDLAALLNPCNLICILDMSWVGTICPCAAIAAIFSSNA